MPSALFAEQNFRLLVAAALTVAAIALAIVAARRWRRSRERRLQAQREQEVRSIVRGVRRMRVERDPVRRRAMGRELQARFIRLAEGAGGRSAPSPHLLSLYRVLAHALTRSPEVNLTYGERLVDERLGATVETVRRYGATYRLLAEAEASIESQLFHALPESGQRALLLVYFYALEEYLSTRLLSLVPRGATLLLGDRGHINLRRRGWEARWAELSLGNLVYMADWNRHLFIADDFRWNREVEPLLRQAVEARNRTAHPGWPTPNLDLVRRLVFGTIVPLEEVLKRPLPPERLAYRLPAESPVIASAGRPGGSPRAP